MEHKDNAFLRCGWEERFLQEELKDVFLPMKVQSPLQWRKIDPQQHMGILTARCGSSQAPGAPTQFHPILWTLPGSWLTQFPHLDVPPQILIGVATVDDVECLNQALELLKKQSSHL